MQILNLQSLSFAYKIYKEKETYIDSTVIDNLDLVVNENEKVLIIAEPKKGKTTILHIIAGFAPYYQKGELKGLVKIKDKEYSMPLELSGIVSLVEQNSQDQILCTTVENEIAFYLEQKCYDYNTMKTIVNREIKRFDLENLRNSNPTELSGGERKRLTLALSFATDSDLYLLDESFDELDLLNQKKLASIIKQSNKSFIVTSSRYKDVFDNVFDKIYTIKDKKLVEYEKEEKTLDPIITKVEDKVILDVESLVIQRTKTSDQNQHFYLEVPYFYLKKGEVIGLVGANGSGKTTFASCLCNLVKEKSGVIKKTMNIGYVMQNPDYQLFNSTCEKELDATLKYSKYSKEEKNRLKEFCYSTFNFKKDDNPFLLDQGNRKFLQLSINYLLDRDIYILDEIDTSLTLKQVSKVINVLLKKGSSVILISHDDFIIKQCCNRQYLIKDNKVVLV